METSILVAIIAGGASLVASLLLYRSGMEARKVARAESRAKARAESRAKAEEDTTTIRIKRIESADEFREELLNLWRESREGWAKCERDRLLDQAEAARAHAANKAEISDLRSELREFKRKLCAVDARPGGVVG